MSSDNKSKQSKQDRLPSSVPLDRLKYDDISYQVVKVREASTFLKDGKSITLDEKWVLAAMYSYPNGKTEKLHVLYNALPCRAVDQVSTVDGLVHRKMFARVDEGRVVYRSLIHLNQVLRGKAQEAIMTTDCSKVFPLWTVSVVVGSKAVPVTYSAYITAHLAGATEIPVGKSDKSGSKGNMVPIDTVKDALLEALDGEDNIVRDGLMKLPTPDSDYTSGSKFIELTTYPDKAKSSDPDDVIKFERAKVEGMRKLAIWCGDDLRHRLQAQKLLPEAGWVPFKNGRGYYTTDYHIKTHIAEQHTPWIALSATFSWRQSINPKNNEYRIKLDEEITQGDLVDIRPAEVSKKVSEAKSMYQEEFGSGSSEPPEFSGSNRLEELAGCDEVRFDDERDV